MFVHHHSHEPSWRPEKGLPRGLREALAIVFGDRFTTYAVASEQYRTGAYSSTPERPDAVVFPRSAGEVAQAVSLCRAYRVPVPGWGTDPSASSRCGVTQGGVCIDMSLMGASALAPHEPTIEA